MKAVKRSVFVVGITLCVIPLFGSAYAQSNSNSAQVLLEMQAMRAEIADLRDMVERQQFELKKLKQRNAEIAAAQTETEEKLAAQIAKSQNAAPVSAYPRRPLNNAQLSDSSYGGYPDVGVAPSQQAQLQAQANPNGQIVEQSLDKSLNQRVATELNQAEASTDVSQPSVLGGGETAGSELLAAAESQGPEIVERSFNSSDLNQPTLSAEQVAQAAQPAVAQVEPTISGVQQAIEAPASSIPGSLPDQGTLLDSVSNDSQLADSVTTVTGNQSGSSPILSVPTTVGAASAQTPINGAQVPVAPVVDSGVETAVDLGAESGVELNGQEKLVASVETSVESNQPAQVADAVEQGESAITEAPSVQPTSAATALSEDDYYDQGFEYLKQSNYKEAIDTFNQQVAIYPNGDLADDAHYWIAEAYFINRQPAQAKPHLRIIIDNYPTSARLPDAMLKTAYIEQDTGNLIEARILLQEVVARHPSSNAAIAARNRLENLQSNN